MQNLLDSIPLSEEAHEQSTKNAEALRKTTIEADLEYAVKAIQNQIALGKLSAVVLHGKWPAPDYRENLKYRQRREDLLRLLSEKGYGYRDSRRTNMHGIDTRELIITW